MTEEYENMTVSELKEILKEKGLPVSGTKKTLIERLSEDSETNETLEDIEEEIQEDEFDEEYEDFEDDDWDDEELGIHVTKQKPELDASTLSALKLRNLQSKSTPTFRRTEWFRYKRLSKSGWRRPKGMDNSQRKNLRYRGSKVRIGHGKISTARGLHPSGFREVMVHNPLDLEKINPANEAARIGATVGGRKREQIHLKADELGIRILNRSRNL